MTAVFATVAKSVNVPRFLSKSHIILLAQPISSSPLTTRQALPYNRRRRVPTPTGLAARFTEHADGPREPMEAF